MTGVVPIGWISALLPLQCVNGYVVYIYDVTPNRGFSSSGRREQRGQPNAVSITVNNLVPGHVYRWEDGVNKKHVLDELS